MTSQKSILSFFTCSQKPKQTQPEKLKRKSNGCEKSTKIKNSQEVVVIDDEEDEVKEQASKSNDYEKSSKISDDSVVVIDDEEFEVKKINNSQEIVVKDHDEVEIKTQSCSPSKRDIDYPTLFFFDMIESFLDQKELEKLFDSTELEIISDLYELKNDAAKILFVRLYWLQPDTWYRTSKIVKKYLNTNYVNLSNRGQEAINLLCIKHLFVKAKNFDIDDYASQLTLPELIEVAKYFKIKTQKCNKEQLVDELKKSGANNTLDKFFKLNSATGNINILKKLSAVCGDCVKINDSVRQTFNKLHVLMYLGTNPAHLREKKLNLMLSNVKNGQQHYPCYDLDIESPIFLFPEKDIFDEFIDNYFITEQLIELSTQRPFKDEIIITLGYKLIEYLRKKDLSIQDNCLPAWNYRFTATYQCIKGLEISINSYKRLNLYDDVLYVLSSLLDQKLYRRHKRSGWYEEKALILQKRLMNESEFINVLCEALEDPLLDDDDKASLKDRAQSFMKSSKCQKTNVSLTKLTNLLQSINYCDNLPHKTIIGTTTMGNIPGQKSKYVYVNGITGDKIYSSVEDYAILYYCNEDDYTNGQHWEGRIITSIFSLLFWDIIYSEVKEKKGIFVSKYQEVPLDLYSSHFYENRKTAIDTRLDDVLNKWKINETIEFMNYMRESIKDGTVSLYNDNIGFDEIKEVVQCLGGNGLYHICKRLAMSYHYCHSGFPDITLWNTHTKKLKFVEVKGAGDRPSFKQIQWILYMLENNIETEVCYVENIHSNKVTKKRDSRGRVLRVKKEVKKTTPKKKSNSSADEFTPTKSNAKESLPDSPRVFFKTPTKSPRKSPRSGSSSPIKMSPKARRNLSLTKRRLMDIDK